MFDPVSRRLLGGAPDLPDLPAEQIADALTRAYAEIAAARITLVDRPDDLRPQLAEVALSMSRIADLLEAKVVLGLDADRIQSAAFVAGSARQLLFQINRLSRGRIESWADDQSISPEIAAGLLFMIAGRSADAYEMARFLFAPADLPGASRAAIFAVKDFLQGQLRYLVRMARRPKYGPRLDGVPSPETAVDLMYRAIVRGLADLSRDLLGTTAGVGLERALSAFQQVRTLAVAEETILDLADEGIRLETRSMFPGPHHLASLLQRATPTFNDAAIVKIPTPGGAKETVWREWLSSEARRWPYLWENHRRATETGYLDAGNSAVMSSPTGSGKSTLALLKMVSCVAGGRSVVYLAPTHALVSQIERDLSKRLPSSASATSLEEALDEEIGQRLPDIAVMTPERCFALLTYAPEVFANVGLLVFDECHLLGASGPTEMYADPDRRSIDAMLCLLTFVGTVPAADILLMSAMMSNGADLRDWVASLTGRECKLFEDEWKPTRQLKGAVVYDRAELAAVREQLAEDWASRDKRPSQAPAAVRTMAEARPYAVFALSENWNAGATDRYALRQLSAEPLPLGVGTRRRGWAITANRNEVAAAIATQFQRGGLKAIVFCESIVTTTAVADRVNAASEGVPQLNDEETAWLETAIKELGAKEAVYAPGDGPAAVHHGELLPEERHLAESTFKRRRSGVNVLAATSTLAQGLNLPCELVVLAGTDRADDADDGPRRKDLEPHEILNALGRAGRAGLAATGLALVVPAEPIECDPPTDRVAADPLFDMMFSGQDKCVPLFDPIAILFDRIALHGVTDDEATYLLRKLAIGLGAAPEGVETFDQLAKRSFGYFQRARADAAAANAWVAERRAALEAYIEAAQEQPAEDWQAALAAKTGANPQFISRIVAAYAAAPHDAATAREWLKWLLEQLLTTEWEFDLFLRPATLERVFGRAFNQCEDYEQARGLAREGVLLALEDWLTGAPLLKLEQTIADFITANEGPVPRPTRPDAKAKRARRFALRLAPDLGYLCGLLSYIARKLTTDAGEEPPLILEALPQLVRKGVDTPIQLHVLRSEKLSRVAAHESYRSIADYVEEGSPQSWDAVRNAWERAETLRLLDDGGFSIE